MRGDKQATASVRVARVTFNVKTRVGGRSDDAVFMPVLITAYHSQPEYT